MLGSPIAHSLSPALHRAAYRELGVDWSYSAHEVDQPQLAGFMAALTEDWRGLSLTMPLKQRVIGLCDQVETRGRLLGSINTVVIDVDGIRSGHNTDVHGMVRSLESAGVERLDRVLVVGSGATAASALAAVAELGASHVTVLARVPSRAQALVDLGPALNLDVVVVAFDAVASKRSGPRSTGSEGSRGMPLSSGPVDSDRVDVVISTIPVEGQTNIADYLGGCAPAVFDVIYSPRHTPLLTAAAGKGATVIGGFELLLHQAARQVELMTGVRQAPLAAMRAAGVAALADRESRLP